MENQTTFSYTYTASQQRQVQEIRKKYLPDGNKLEELKRLDRNVQMAGIGMSLTVGMIGTALAAVGVMMIAGLLAGGALAGIPLAMLGIAGILAAYPIRCAARRRMHAKSAARIIQLTDELSGAQNFHKT